MLEPKFPRCRTRPIFANAMRRSGGRPAREALPPETHRKQSTGPNGITSAVRIRPNRFNGVRSLSASSCGGGGLAPSKSERKREQAINKRRRRERTRFYLITEDLGADGVAGLFPVARELGMATLVEVHSEESLESVLDRLGLPGRGSYILGINNRDLAIQRTDVSTTSRLATLLPQGCPFAAESGIATRDDVLTVQTAGACAILVGESLLRARNIGAQIDMLLGK